MEMTIRETQILSYGSEGILKILIAIKEVL
jgi:hypothetical protein